MYTQDIINITYLISIIAAGDIILKVIGIATALVILGFNIWKWVKAAKADGKITKEEIEEGKKIIVDGLEDLEEEIRKDK